MLQLVDMNTTFCGQIYDLFLSDWKDFEAFALFRAIIVRNPKKKKNPLTLIE